MTKFTHVRLWVAVVKYNKWNNKAKSSFVNVRRIALFFGSAFTCLKRNKDDIQFYTSIFKIRNIGITLNIMLISLSAGKYLIVSFKWLKKMIL